MRSEGRRKATVGLVLLATGLILGGVGATLRSTVRPALPDLTGAAQQAHLRIEQALAGQARALEPKVSAAGRIRELQAALDMGADRATCQDLLDNEEWWAPYRTAYPLSALIADGPLAVVGPGTNGLAESEMIRRARERGVASGVLPGTARAFLAAAATVSLSKRPGIAPVVLLGNLLDGSALKGIAELTGDAVGLSDGTKLLEAAGRSEPGRTLGTLVGREGSTPLLFDDGRMGAAWPIGGRLWILAAVTAPPLPKPAESSSSLLLLIAGGSCLLAGVMLMAAGRRGSAAPLAGATGENQAIPVSSSTSLYSGGTYGGRAAGGGPVPHAPAYRSPAAEQEDAAAMAGNRGRVPTNRPRPEGSSSATPDAAMGLDGGAAARAGVAHAPTFNAAPAPMAPNIMGRYELIERIGEGGMAEIFFAAARGAENFVRYFVVKRMHPQLARNQDAVNQFIDEGRLQAGLVHSNIVPVFDFGKAEGEYFLALEYIHGKDVGQIVQRHAEQFGRPLEMGVAFYIVHDVLEALAYAHSQMARDGTPMDIVHRDVSPGNVLVSYRGEVKLTDFGIAKADRRVSRTDVGMVKGNASFMSPEQARGEVVDLRSDVFSAGLVLFYCLTGQYLYRGETTLNRLLRAAVGPATSQFDQIDLLPLPAARVLRRALALDPQKRYANAVEFARELTPHMGGRANMTQIMDALFPTSLRRDLR